MKKHLLRALCLLTLSMQLIHAENNENGLELVMQEYTTSFLDLPIKKQALTLLSGVGGGACTLLITRAVTNIFQAKERVWNVLDPQTYTWVEYGTGPVGTILAAKFVGDYFKPEAVAQQANENGLLTLLLENENVVEALDAKFVTNHFPRATAFAQLASLRDSLTHLLKLTETYNNKRPKKHFYAIRNRLLSNLKTVDNALLLIKKDDRWHLECNAYTLQQVQKIQQADQNARFAGAAVNLAHAYAKSR